MDAHTRLLMQRKVRGCPTVDLDFSSPPFDFVTRAFVRAGPRAARSSLAATASRRPQRGLGEHCREWSSSCRHCRAGNGDQSGRSARFESMTTR